MTAMDACEVHTDTETSVPARCAAGSPRSTAEATIRVLNEYIKTQFWIHAEDLYWLLLYLADELVTQNVPIDSAVAEEDVASRRLVTHDGDEEDEQE